MTRIASLQPSITLTLAALDRLDALCAITKYCPEAIPSLAARNLPILHDSWSFDKPGNLDLLLAARPDAVIASVPYRMESLAAILKSGLPVLALAPHSLADVYADTRLIASIAHADPEPLIARMQRTIAETQKRTAHVAPDQKPLVYCEEWGKPLIHSQLWVKELVEAAGGIFLGQPGQVTSAEAIAVADPEVVIAAWCGAGDRVPLEKLAARSGWSGMRAVRSGRVYCIRDEWLNTPAPTLIHGLRALVAALHPDIPGTPEAIPRRLENPSTAACV